jgi:hypothetical protein
MDQSVLLREPMSKLPVIHCASAAWAGGLACVVYLVFFGGHYVMGDHVYRMAWAKSLLDHGSHDISAYVPGTQHSVYGIGHSVLHIPFLLLARGIKATSGISCEGPLAMLVYVLNGALGVSLVNVILQSVGVGARQALWRSLAIGIASVWFPYTKLEYGESLVTTLVLLMWYTAPRRPVLAGLIGGMAITIRMDALLWTGITAMASPVTRREKAKVVLGLVPGICITAWSNWLRTGLIHTAGYEAGFVNPLYIGVCGMLVSAGKSMFLFSPLLLLFLPAVRACLRNPSTRNLASWSVALLCTQVIFFGCWWDWSGDDAWGPRFVILSTMAAQIVIAASPLASGMAFKVLVLLGLLAQLPPVLMGPHTSLMLNHAAQPQKADIYLRSRSPITLDDVRFHPRYSQVTATFELLGLKAFGARPSAHDQRLTGSSWLESFDPPLVPTDLAWDLFWLHLRDNRPAGSYGN